MTKKQKQLKYKEVDYWDMTEDGDGEQMNLYKYGVLVDRVAVDSLVRMWLDSMKNRKFTPINPEEEE